MRSTSSTKIFTMVRAREEVNVEGEEQLSIYSDCKNLVKLVSGGTLAEVPSWQATEEVAVAQCILLLTEMRDWISVHHINRAALNTPHRMANWARTNNRRIQGIQEIVTLCEITLDPALENENLIVPL